MGPSETPSTGAPATVSVVIPAYNSGAFLAEALASVARQTAPVHEVIVVDDCSSDDTAAIARRGGATVLSTGTNVGPSRARNLGIRTATGTHVAMLDADDTWEPDHCSVLVALIAHHPDAVLGASRVADHATGRAITRIRTPEDEPLDVYLQLLRENLVPQIAMLVRRDAVLALGGYDESRRYSEDYDLWLRLARVAPFVFSHAVTARYRSHPGQATRAQEALCRGAWDVRRSHIVWIRAHRPDVLEPALGFVRAAFDDEARWAWSDGHAALLETLFEASAWVPGLATEHRRWRMRRRYTWHAWRLAKRVRDAMRGDRA